MTDFFQEWNVNDPHVELRKRILKIAASYIGQTTYSSRKGFNDSAFESKMKNVGWSTTQHYCNYFCILVYKEALTTGNQYVNSTLNNYYQDILILPNTLWQNGEQKHLPQKEQDLPQI